MTSEVHHDGGLATEIVKKARESKRSRRCRKQKKNKASDATGDESDASTVIDGCDNAEAEAVEVEPGGSEEDVKKDEADVDEAGGKRVDSDEEVEEKEKAPDLSNKQKKLQRRMKIAELKKICSRPDVVEVWDATAADPKLLVFLKSYRNTVPVPRHWSQKRKFLQGKRGMDKKPYELPDYIAETGIAKLRQAYIEKENNKKVKQKQRDRVKGKKGELDIDYVILHDAFFKHMKKPPLTSHGDLYYEGKEFEAKLKERKPGMLSQQLKDALGMEKALFGYHTGGWGKPPVDQHGHPLYGDVFGLQLEEPNYEEEAEDKTKHWGDFDPEEEEVEEDEEEVEVPDEKEVEDDVQSVDSVSSTPTGLETPDVFELRKQQRKEPEKPLYQVLELKDAKIAPGTLLGTSHTGQSSDVEVSLNPEELEGMENVLPAKYEEACDEKKLLNKQEDFSDMVAENAKKRQRKMKEKVSKSKKKGFKF
ncbi:hypothetical protein DCAR_0101718 [Daucus carota subsp. sativus]|uniref:Uncharacterized protein n=1 Tax=Daucus carota subsp. sativus TaxID=79200 RepID=A0A166GLB7_DAUCS|nr:hypothetical protein DCAR_0101718 [Daucus carota subsp. sativus]